MRERERAFTVLKGAKGLVSVGVGTDAPITHVVVVADDLVRVAARGAAAAAAVVGTAAAAAGASSCSPCGRD